MFILMSSAALVGFVHSLAPGHWLPVVLLAKTRCWKPSVAAAASLVTAGGHIFLSILLSAIAIAAGATYLHEHEDLIEKYAGLGLAIFGVLYAIFSFRRHSHCQGHTHHGPNPPARDKTVKRTVLFLFSVGFSPCAAVLPVFVAAMPFGWTGYLLTGVSFSAGVIAALAGSSLVASMGVLKLDHPIFEHFGDVLTGVGVALLGLVLFVTGGH
jgi:ABC-type nickel/cobalt efflux system permease component RcnA